MNKVKMLVLVALVLPVAAFAQTATDPVTVVTGASVTAQTAWAGFAAISASAFVFGMIIGYARKGRK